MSGESRRGRPNRASKSAKVHPIKEDELPADELPCDVDAERFVLGAVLLDDTKFSEIAALAPKMISRSKGIGASLARCATCTTLARLSTGSLRTEAMKTIFRRLQRSEQRFAPPAPAPSGPSFAEQIADGIAVIGFVRGEKESLAETFARFLGIAPSELRAWLQRRAAGQPAE